MPYLNEDGTLDTVNVCIRKCDHCGAVEKVFDEPTGMNVGRWEEIYALEQEIYELFKGTRGPGLPDVLCIECMRKVMPNLHKLRDAIELDIFVNRLKGAINEKRKQGTQDHRATADDACQCCERCPQRRLGHRACHGTAQAGEEHKREPVQRNQDCHVQP